MSYIGIPPQANFSSGLLDRFTSTTGNTVTLTHEIASENDIVCFVNFVKQDSTTYSVGGTGNKTLTLGGTLVSSDIVEVHYLNIVGQTVNPSANSVGSSQISADVITGQTALAVAPASTDELLISDGGVLKRVDVSLVGGTNTPMFLAESSTNQSITNTTHTDVVFGTEVIDTDNAFASNTFTVPSGKAGKYFFHAQTGQEGWSSNRFLITLFKNNSTNVALSEETVSQSYYQTVNTSVIVDMSVGDTMEVQIYHDSGSTRNISSGRKTVFFGYKLIE